MKILQIETLYSAGGIPRIVRSLMDVVKENGDECKFVFGRQRVEVIPQHKNDTFLMEGKLEIYSHVLKSRLFDRSGFGSKAATKRLIKFIKEYDPDVIHLHSLLGYYINIKVLFNYLAEAGKPVVWTQHDCWAITGHCIHFVNVGCDKWKTGCHSCSQKGTYPPSIFADSSRRNYREKKELFTSVPNMTLVTPSEWLAGFMRQSFLSKYPIRVIPNGIDLNLYKPMESDLREKYNIGDKKILLGVAGTWAPTKGLHHLCKAYEALGSEKYQLVVIGVSEEQQASLPENTISFKRTTNVEELIKWYSAADVFLNATTADNFPTVNLESLACGTPVITFPTGGSVESVDKTCGIVTEAQTTEALIKAIKELECSEITREACIKRSKLYDSKARYLEYYELYRELCGKNK